MANFAKDEFIPKNPQKYNGKYPIIYRSSWEWSVMTVFDSNPAVVAWQSESISIPYRNPLTGKWSIYIPDFFVVFMDVKGNHRAELIEVKPMKETPGYKGKCSPRDKLAQAINAAKWTAAFQYCIKRGWVFHPLTEQDICKFKRKS